MTVQQAFQLALQHHQAGRLAEAEALYRQILAVDPRHADALHLLGVVAAQAGRHDVAVELMTKAVTLKPNYPQAHTNLGNALSEKGRLDEAIASHRRAIALKPDFSEGHSNLGNALRDQGQLDEAVAAYRQAIALKPNFPEAHSGLGNALRDRGQLIEAIAAYRQAITLKGNYPEAWNNLGNVLGESGQLDEAAASCRQAIALKPNFPEAHSSLGNALRDQGQLDEAVAAYRQAIALKPNFPEAHYNLGIALSEKGRTDEAIAAYRQAIALKPNYPKAHSNLGVALRDQGQLEQAIAAYRQAIALDPDLPEVQNNLGNALRDQGQLDEAVASCRRALGLKPNYPGAHLNLGNALRDQGRLDEAIASYRQAVALDPNVPQGHNNFGNALKDMGQLDEAFTAYRRALEIRPDHPEAHSNLVLALHYHPGFDFRAIAEECDRWSQQHAAALRQFIEPHSNNPNSVRRLRIGYISADFGDHVVGRNVLPVLERHNRAQFEVFLYANGLKSDALSGRFERAANVWQSITGTPDQEVAKLVRANRIDILIDLSLHTTGNRLLVLARKPAPVQVTWAGYPGSTGLDSIDYRLTDPYLDPPGTSDEYYSEKSIRLPHSFWCFDPLTPSPAVNPLPALSAGHITFGSLNNYCKVNQGVLELWAKVLHAVKDSHLLLLSKQGAHRLRALEVFQHHGVAADRIEWFTPAAREQYLEAYHRADLGLDTFPYNGHTTSLDSFWMGVPVITLVGKTVVGRAGLSQAMNLGLPELVARTAEEYLVIAADFAADLPRLAKLRQSLRSRVEASPLMDAAGFTRDIEAAYRAVWERWCMERKPARP